jgi:hypothetical protein
VKRRSNLINKHFFPHRPLRPTMQSHGPSPANKYAPPQYLPLLICSHTHFLRHAADHGLRFRVGFGPEVANGVIAKLFDRSGFMCVLINAQPFNLRFKCLSRNLELGCCARRTANAPLRFR